MQPVTSSSITHLEVLIKTKDAQIAELVEKLSEIEKTNYSETDDDSDILNTSEIEDFEPEATTSKVIPQILMYYRDYCDFRTQHEVGLKIHKSKSHKFKCENCDLFF